MLSNLHFGRLRAVWLGLIITGTGALGSENQKELTDVKVFTTPPADGKNDFYPGNRLPLLPSPLIKLPAGSVRPEGWLQHQLALMADGFIGRLSEISQWCQFKGSAWTNLKGEGQFGWEELPYWLKGFVALGYGLPDQRIIDEANRWVEAILASQRPNGYFGSQANYTAPDLWPNMVVLYALRTYYEATADRRILPFMTRYFQWVATIPPDRFLPGSWQQWRGGDQLDSLYWLYNRTGEAWLLDLARTNHAHSADWFGGIPTWHGVNLCQGFREPAQFYQQTQDRRYLQATERNYATVMELYGQVPGGMFGADENCRPGFAGPRQGAETCSIAEFMYSDELLARITGEVIYADRCEEIAFNSLPAALTPDLKGLHYLTAPNMVQLDRTSKAPLLQNPGDMLSYNPHEYRCCQHNIAFGWPYFAEHLWMATPGNGLAALLYAPSRIRAKAGPGVTVEIQETTDYPFDGVIHLTLSTSQPVPFPLWLRIPGWCEQPGLALNGTPCPINGKASGWLALKRTWHNGDRVRLELPMAIRFQRWEKNRNTVSVHRGPLAYSLKIGERWQRCGGTDRWPAFEVFPTTPWNYGLLFNAQPPGLSFTLTRQPGPLAAQPFTVDSAPIYIRARGQRIAQWKLESNGLVGDVPPGPVRSDEAIEEITLIPMGCARLRISAFPLIQSE